MGSERQFEEEVRRASELRFEEEVRRASERYRGQKRTLLDVEKSAREDPEFARVAAAAMFIETRGQRRRWRRYLYSRFGVKVSPGKQTRYEERRPERAPKTRREKLDRAKAVVGHAEWESRWKALNAGLASFGPEDRFFHAVRLHCDAARQAPGVWAFVVEIEPDDSVREHAMVELAGWLDTETVLTPSLRDVLGGREEKLRELAGSFAEARAHWQPDEPVWVPNRVERRRTKGSLVGRVGSSLDSLRRSAARGAEIPDSIGAEDEELLEFERQETLRQDLDRLKGWVEHAGFSGREAQVYELDMQTDFDTNDVAERLGIPTNKVRDYRGRYVAKLRKLREAAGL